MPKCDCGAEVSRYKVHVESPDGKPLPTFYTTCSECRPNDFSEALTAPSDRKIYVGHEFEPNRYKKNSDGKYVATDEWHADRQAWIKQGETDRQAAYDKVRKRKAGIPALTPMQIESIKDFFGPLEEQRKKRKSAQEAGIVIP